MRMILMGIMAAFLAASTPAFAGGDIGDFTVTQAKQQLRLPYLGITMTFADAGWDGKCHMRDGFDTWPLSPQSSVKWICGMHRGDLVGSDLVVFDQPVDAHLIIQGYIDHIFMPNLRKWAYDRASDVTQVSSRTDGAATVTVYKSKIDFVATKDNDHHKMGDTGSYSFITTVVVLPVKIGGIDKWVVTSTTHIRPPPTGGDLVAIAAAS